jgi:hypothetical protein
MKLFKRLSTFILSCALVLLITPAKVQAQDFSSAKVDEALAFIQGKGLLVGTVTSSSINDDAVILELIYSTGAHATYIYKELINGDIELTITESHASDTFVFKNNGDIYVDEVFDIDLTSANNASINMRNYASYFYTNIPAGVSESDFGPEVTSGGGWLVVGESIATTTVAYLAVKMAVNCGLLSSDSSHFTVIAEGIISAAIALGLYITGLSFTTTTSTDNTQAPNVYTYRHKRHFSVGNYVYDSLPYYEQKYLL